MKRLLLILVLVLAACAVQEPVAKEPVKQEQPSMITEVTVDYVKYDTDTSPNNMEAYKADCKQRDGTFDECGPSCPPDAEFCVQVCTPTCNLKSEADTQPKVNAEPEAKIKTISQPTTHQIIIEDFKFKPKVFTIEKGDTITWTNRGPSTHSVSADGGTFDSFLLGKGQSWSYRFDETGLFQYHCTPHRGMRASITVE